MKCEYRTLSFGSGYGNKHDKVSDALERLDQEVNVGLANGWKLVGGVTIAINGINAVVAQAMVLEPTQAQSTPEAE